MDYGSYLQFVLTLVFVIGLIFAIAFIAKRLGFGHGPAMTGNKNKRIEIKEVRPLDARRKIVLIQCDDKEHLLLIGGTQDLHIHSSSCNASTPVITSITEHTPSSTAQSSGGD
ncbi:FliO/MopB family protein [Kiloniella sp.]|uniref:FliO/MopB family protein n=1 Tax=Kiloniella sp. TaxID=1938587 RepID=UPI003B0155A2